MTMRAGDASDRPNAVRARSLAHHLRKTGAACGILIGVGLVAPVALAQNAEFRSADSAPAAWQNFAMGLQSRFNQRLAADDKDVREFGDELAKRYAGTGVEPLTFVARTWISPGGKIQRLEFDGLEDQEVAAKLRALLTRGDVGAPPPDMLQPLRLRLALQPKAQPAGDK
jgi:hypothetical protein